MRYAIFCTLLFCPGAALAHECVKPSPPALIDKDSALPEERNAMTGRIDAYIRSMNVYLECLERSDANARAEAKRLINAWAQPDEAVEVVID